MATLRQGHSSDQVTHRLPNGLDIEHFADGLEFGAPHREDRTLDQHVRILEILRGVFRSSPVVVEAAPQRAWLRVRFHVLGHLLVRE